MKGRYIQIEWSCRGEYPVEIQHVVHLEIMGTTCSTLGVKQRVKSKNILEKHM